MATQLIAPPMTVDEFVLAYGDDDRFELVEGEVHEREVSGYTHFTVQSSLKELLDRAGVRNLGYRCVVEASSKFRRTAVVPDVSLIRAGRLQGLTGNSPFDGSPDIAFEVAISDAASVLESKVSGYLAAGAHAVCVVYPDLRSVVVYRGREAHRLSESDTLEFPDLLPGLAIPVSAIFADLEPLPHNP